MAAERSLTGLVAFAGLMRLPFYIRALVVAVAVAFGCVAVPHRAAADGDPGSDVLVSQSLFVPADAGVGVAAQTRLAALLARAKAEGFPVRVAIIAHPGDLGSVSALWGKPASYARFLGIELSLAFKGPLLVVMPDGFGFHWPGHVAAAHAAASELASIKIASGGGLGAVTSAALGRLASSIATHAPSATTRTTRVGAVTDGALTVTGGAASGPTGAPTILSAAHGPTTPVLVAVIVWGLLAIALIGWLLVRAGVVGPRRRVRCRGLRPPSATWALSSVAILAAAAIVALLTVASPSSPTATASDLASNPDLDPGQSLSGARAPNFALYDQFGKRMTLGQYRGKVVLLAFNDSECTTICPLTTSAMLDAKRLLGSAGRRVQLLGVDANPKATQVQDVLSYSQLHGLTHKWRFGTGSLRQLRRVWRAYHVQAAIDKGLISHTPALLVIDQKGRERKLYVTQQSYTAVPQLGQLLAREISLLLPGHPHVASRLSYAKTPTIAPTVSAELPRSGGGTVRIGPGADHLYVFFDTWDREVMPIGGRLDALDGYARAAARLGLPDLTAIDEGSVEPSPAALPRFLHDLVSPLAYPVGIDNTGEVADGYQVQGEPWLALTSAKGKILWSREPDTAGWPTTRQLATQVRAAISHGPAPPASLAAAEKQLKGSPALLASLHRQADRLVGDQSGLAARIKTLRGYPIVVNIWASDCVPCRSEFGLLASASAHYGRSVAFLGADYDDQAGAAQAFLRQHPVSYPSYTASDGQLSSLVPDGLQGIPTTIYITPSGRVSSTHLGAYESQGTLDGDIARITRGYR